MSTPWYLTATALPILASLRANPPRVATQFETIGRTRDERHVFTGERVDRLTALYDAKLEQHLEAGAMNLARALMAEGNAQDVIAGMLGTWLPGIHFISDMDRLARIGEAVGAALDVKAAA